jgi:outer membrane protein assembly factor BamE (lipoprotein component of BamABCDE complex)
MSGNPRVPASPGWECRFKLGRIVVIVGKYIACYLAICAWLIIGIAGCTLEKGTEVTQEQAAFIEKGKTTYNDIIAHFGTPQRSGIRNNQRFVDYIYRSETASAGNVLSVATGVPRSLAGGPNVKVTVLVIFFDSNNIVSDFSYAERNTTGEPVRIKQ